MMPSYWREIYSVKNVKIIPLCHQTDYIPAYIKHCSSAFKEEHYNKEGKYLDEEFFFSLLSSRGFDINDVRWIRCDE